MLAGWLLFVLLFVCLFVCLLRLEQRQVQGLVSGVQRGWSVQVWYGICGVCLAGLWAVVCYRVDSEEPLEQEIGSDVCS